MEEDKKSATQNDPTNRDFNDNSLLPTASEDNDANKSLDYDFRLRSGRPYGNENPETTTTTEQSSSSSQSSSDDKDAKPSSPAGANEPVSALDASSPTGADTELRHRVVAGRRLQSGVSRIPDNDHDISSLRDTTTDSFIDVEGPSSAGNVAAGNSGGLPSALHNSNQTATVGLIANFQPHQHQPHSPPQPQQRRRRRPSHRYHQHSLPVDVGAADLDNDADIDRSDASETSSAAVSRRGVGLVSTVAAFSSRKNEEESLLNEQQHYQRPRRAALDHNSLDRWRRRHRRGGKRLSSALASSTIAAAVGGGESRLRSTIAHKGGPSDTRNRSSATAGLAKPSAPQTAATMSDNLKGVAQALDLQQQEEKKDEQGNYGNISRTTTSGATLDGELSKRPATTSSSSPQPANTDDEETLPLQRNAGSLGGAQLVKDNRITLQHFTADQQSQAATTDGDNHTPRSSSEDFVQRQSSSSASSPSESGVNEKFSPGPTRTTNTPSTLLSSIDGRRHQLQEEDNLDTNQRYSGFRRRSSACRGLPNTVLPSSQAPANQCSVSAGHRNGSALALLKRYFFSGNNNEQNSAVQNPIEPKTAIVHSNHQQYRQRYHRTTSSDSDSSSVVCSQTELAPDSDSSSAVSTSSSRPISNRNQRPPFNRSPNNLSGFIDRWALFNSWRRTAQRPEKPQTPPPEIQLDYFKVKPQHTQEAAGDCREDSPTMPSIGYQSIDRPSEARRSSRGSLSASRRPSRSRPRSNSAANGYSKLNHHYYSNYRSPPQEQSYWQAFFRFILLLAIAVPCAILLWRLYEVLVSDYNFLAVIQTKSPLGHYSQYAIATDAKPCAPIGKRVLEKGGSAVDAAISTLICMGVALPNSMGLGGGCLMTLYDAKTRKAIVIDGREVAPDYANENMFGSAAIKASRGPLSVGVPGELAAYWEAHKRYGKLAWHELFNESIALAEHGSPVVEHLAYALRAENHAKYITPPLAKIYFNNKTGEYYDEGEVMRQPILAESLKRIRDNGIDEFYGNGVTGQWFIEDLQQQGGQMKLDDLKRYRALVKEPLEVKLADDLTMYTQPPPGSGIVLSLILRIMRELGYYKSQPGPGDSFESASLFYHRLIESFKYAYAQRAGLEDKPDDPQRMSKLMAELVDEAIIKRAVQNIDNSTHDDDRYGGSKYFKEDHGTAHVSVLDGEGNAIAVTTSVNLYFGSGLVSPRTGIVYNDVMDDFVSPNIVNKFEVAPSRFNRIRPGRRPISSMAPSIYTDGDGNVRLIIGASGGAKITTSVALVSLRNLFVGEDIKTAIDGPRVHHQYLPNKVWYELNFPRDLLESLVNRGHALKPILDRSSVVMAIGCETKTASHQSPNATSPVVVRQRFITANSDHRKGGSVDGL